MVKKKILVINENVGNSFTIQDALSRQGYDVRIAYDEASGVEKAKLEKPDLILLDSNLPGIDGLGFSRKLKEDPTTRFIPIIALVDLVDTLSGVVTSINVEAHLLKPFNAEELKSEIERLLKRTHEQLSANPLTKLPGSVTVEQNVTSRIEKNGKFAVCYLDIDGFKPFNDYYGFFRGDQVIKFLAQLVVEALEQKGCENDVVGHIGGDDFLLVTNLEKVEDVCNYIIEEFDKEIIKYYNPEDLEKGYITTKDRQFQLHNFSVMTLSVSVATNEKREIKHYGKIVDILTEMKKYIKSRKEKKSSIFIKDRRKADL